MYALKSVITCNICQQIYHTPRRMPDGNCGHVFCTDCISKMSESDEGLVICPECNLSQTLPDGGATSLQLDASMERMISSLRCEDCEDMDANTRKCINCGATACTNCSPLHQIPQKCRTLALIRIMKAKIPDETTHQKLADKKQQWENIIPLLDEKRELLTAEYTKLIETLEIHKKRVHSLMEETTNRSDDQTTVMADVVVISKFAEATRHYLSNNNDLAKISSLEKHCIKMAHELDTMAEGEMDNIFECVTGVNMFINKVKWCHTLLTSECSNQPCQTEFLTRCVETQTHISSNNVTTQTDIDMHNIIPETEVQTVDAFVQYTPYISMSVDRVIDTAQHVPDQQGIYTTATCPVTGRLYVCGQRKDKHVIVLVYDQNLHIVKVITTDIPTGQRAPFISVTPVGELLITHGDSTRVTVLDGLGRQLRSVETGTTCQDTVSDGHRLYVCHLSRKRPHVSVYDEHGTLVRDIGSNVLKRPWYIAMDASKRLYVSDAQTRSIHVFTSGGDPIRQITTAGNVAEMAPRSVHVDHVGHVLVADHDHNCVHVFSTEGTWLHTLRDDRIKMAEGLTLTSRREIILVDRTKKSFYVFK